MECTAAHALPQGKGGTQKLCKPLPLDIGVGAGGSTPGTSLPRAMQGLGRWNGQSRQAPACASPRHVAALPVDSKDLLSNWWKGQGLGGAHSHLQPFSAEAPETTLLPKVTLASSSSQTEPWGH